MKKVALIMGMPITIEIADKYIKENIFDNIFKYFHHVDSVFSTYKKNSEISKINDNKIKPSEYSIEMKEIFSLAEKTKNETHGYFNINFKDKLDPSGIVKGWAIYNASKILDKNGYKNYYINAGGDIQTRGRNIKGEKWSIGIQDPWNSNSIVKTIHINGEGVATSGTYERGEHIYNPLKKSVAKDIMSITVIGPNIFDADRFATAAFAMGKSGIHFIEQLNGYEGYLIDKDKKAIYTSNFNKYL